jgi:hypothetical protein
MIKLAAVIAVGASLLLVAGCISSSTVALPDGHQGYTIRCPGAAHDIGDCMNEAAKICAGPYQIVTANGEAVGGAAIAAGNSAMFVSAIHRTLIVECGPAK